MAANQLRRRNAIDYLGQDIEFVRRGYRSQRQAQRNRQQNDCLERLHDRDSLEDHTYVPAAPLRLLFYVRRGTFAN